ncbi:MAG TPA: primary-amine oxidase [Conexibacter sp.]|nr:primary-amine oxidase [Conexibacter sp.]
MTTLAPGSGRPTASAHALDPLTPAEMAAVVAAVRADERVGEPLRFPCVTLDEHAARNGERRAEAIVRDAGARRSWNISVALDGETGTATADRWSDIGDEQPAITPHESRLLSAACREHPDFVAGLAKRGITDPSLTMVDAESMGGFVPERYSGRRVAWGATWHREDLADNGYARPVEGLIPIVDLDTLEILEIEDHGVIRMASERGTFAEGEWGSPRPGLQPLEVEQAEGPSFDVDGWRVDWQGWSLRVGFDHREGLVLHDLTFEHGGRARPVLQRAAVNEMYVPYLDPTATQYRKNFFDWGEYSAGVMTNSLELGCDCLGLIHYFDTAVVDGDGSVRELPHAICMHEEDHGIAWKHTNTRTGEVEVRRSRRLVISTFVTVANYDYGFFWSLYQDGAIELEIKLTGILSAAGIADGETPLHGRMVAPNVQAATHQHYFSVRMDTAVDGPLNRISEIHAEAEPDPAKDPYGNAVRAVRTVLASEAQAARRNDPARAAFWRVESDSATNRYGEPTAYRLHVDSTATPFARPHSVSGRRAPFTEQHVWATKRTPSERYVGGEYPNQAEPGADGIHVWQQADRSLDPAELVVWATVGTHHFPRPEDWPVMPVARGHLRFEPDGFFDRNPTLDLPRPAKAAGHCEKGCH